MQVWLKTKDEARDYLDRLQIAERRVRQLHSPGKVPSAKEVNEGVSVSA